MMGLLDFLLVWMADIAREYQTTRISTGFIVDIPGKKLNILNFQWN